MFQDRSYNADQTCWVWGRPEISTLRLVKSTEGTRRACWMHADENILRDKLHKYAICRRSRYVQISKMYPTFWMFCDHYDVSGFFVSGVPNTASRRTKTVGHRFNPIHQHLVFLGILWIFCDRFPLDLSIFDLFNWLFGQLESACFRLQENLGILQRLENAWHLSSPNSIRRSEDPKILRRPHDKQAAYNVLQCLQPLQRKDHVHAMSSSRRHVHQVQVQVVVPAVAAPWLEFEVKSSFTPRMPSSRIPKISPRNRPRNARRSTPLEYDWYTFGVDMVKSC